MKNQTTAIILILVGVYFLMSNLGLINFSLREVIGVWWPLIPIAIGVSWLVSGKR